MPAEHSASTPNASWVRLPSAPLSPRQDVAGGWVGQGFVVVGGWSNPPCPPGAACAAPRRPALRDGARYDPARGTWARISPAPTPVSGGNTAVVGGLLYVLTWNGGRTDSPTSFSSYDPRRDAWTRLALPPGESPDLVAAGDRVIAVSNSDERRRAVDSEFDPRTRRWHRLPDDPLGPSFNRKATWLGGRLLLTAVDLVAHPGARRPALTRLAVLSVDQKRWKTLPDSQIIGGNPIAVADLVVFPGTTSAYGGGSWDRSYPAGGIFDPAHASWQKLPKPPASLGLDRYVGRVGTRTFVGGRLLDPRTRTWTSIPTPPWPEHSSQQTVLTNAHSVFVWGGANADSTANVADGYLLRL